MPAALARLRRQQPALALTVVDDHMQGLLPRLADGELDPAVVYEHPVLPEIAGMALGRAYLFDDAFQPPAVRTMITILETTTRWLRTPAA